MKKTTKICIITIICAVIVLFFPVSHTVSFSGNGHILNSEKEPIGDCIIAIEVTELKSLAVRYKTNFSFARNGIPCYATDEVRFPVSVSETEFGDRLISQFYYDAQSNRMKHCSLFYWGDHSYAEVFWKDSYYSYSPVIE